MADKPVQTSSEKQTTGTKSLLSKSTKNSNFEIMCTVQQQKRFRFKNYVESLICRHLSSETSRSTAKFATALAAQIAANFKVAGFADWLFEVVIQNVSGAAPADSELKLVNLQILWHLIDHVQIQL